MSWLSDMRLTLVVLSVSQSKVVDAPATVRTPISLVALLGLYIGCSACLWSNNRNGDMPTLVKNARLVKQLAAIQRQFAVV